ncbi:hypothetical protein [Roseiconus nitratireducens]|uniref:hypothetical protein n=1 Tax=Roseiconus nitratireducens TaxID=2605748 RepID=UPI0013758411|nr:hypothetical protein [Roseiconus nitratireducens]
MKRFSMALMLVTATFAVLGCERDVMEAETPSGAEVEVEENMATGEYDVEVDD